MKKYALIWCSQNPRMDYREQMRDAFRSDGQHWDILSPFDESFPEQARGYDGYVVSGSEKSIVLDREQPFARRLLALLRHLRAHSGAPVIGICFGAQALAHAYGGEVGPNPDGGFRLGVETLEWSDAARTLEPAGAEQAAALVQSHGECILRLPDASLALASSPSARHEIFLLEQRLLGIQGHPELGRHELKSWFMPLHRPAVDEAAWQRVVQEADIPINRHGVLRMCRQLLAQGRLGSGKQHGSRHGHPTPEEES